MGTTPSDADHERRGGDGSRGVAKGETAVLRSVGREPKQCPGGFPMVPEEIGGAAGDIAEARRRVHGADPRGVVAGLLTKLSEACARGGGVRQGAAPRGVERVDEGEGLDTPAAGFEMVGKRGDDDAAEAHAGEVVGAGRIVGKEEIEAACGETLDGAEAAEPPEIEGPDGLVRGQSPSEANQSEQDAVVARDAIERRPRAVG